jgi:Tol biopolymer transport system component
MKTLIYIISVILLITASVFAQQAEKVFHQSLAWSPDGKYITFTGMRDINQPAMTMKADIYTVRADGSELKKITGDAMNEFYSAWSKAGIAFGAGTAGSKESEIYKVNRDGSNLTQLTGNAGRNSTPDFSRDGKKIAFISTRDGDKPQIYAMNADGSNVTRLTKDASLAFYNPVFSPDGKRIVYYSEKGDRKDQIWMMNADGSNQTLLTGGIGHNIFPAFSPDGKRIIFSSSNRDADKDGSYVEGSFVYVMNTDGSNLTKIANMKSYFARFSPDGKKIAYISGKFPETSIYIANADGSGAMKLTK